MGELPSVNLAERALRLTRTQPFDAFDAADVAILAAAGREIVCPGRFQLVAEGERAAGHWVALTGRLRGLHRGEPLAGDPIEKGFGGLSVLTGLPLPCDVVAEPGTVLFVLDADALLEALEERGRLARTALRAMARSVLANRSEEKSSPPTAWTVAPRRERGTLDLVSRMTALRSAVRMNAPNPAILTRFARAARVESVPRGRNLWPDPAAPADLMVVLEGALDRRPEGEHLPEGRRGAVYGLMETLASVPADRPVIATAETLVMVVSHCEVQEALDDDDRICLALLRHAAFELWNTFWRRHPGVQAS